MMASVARVMGFILLIPLALVYMASGLLVPMPWLLAMYGLYAALVAYAYLQRDRPWHVLATPFGGFALWFAIMSLGDAFLGWTA